MKFVNLSLYDDPYYTYSVALEDNSYIIDFMYNERVQGWFIYLYDAERNPIVLGERLVPNYPIFKDYPLENLTGFFWLERKSDLLAEPYKQYPKELSQYYNFYYIFEE